MNRLQRIKIAIKRVPKWRLAHRNTWLSCPKCNKKRRIRRGQYRYCIKCGWGYPWLCNGCNTELWPDEVKFFWVDTKTGKTVQCPLCGGVF